MYNRILMIQNYFKNENGFKTERMLEKITDTEELQLNDGFELENINNDENIFKIEKKIEWKKIDRIEMKEKETIEEGKGKRKNSKVGDWTGRREGKEKLDTDVNLAPNVIKNKKKLMQIICTSLQKGKGKKKEKEQQRGKQKVEKHQ